MSNEELESELGKAQMLLAYVLQETGDVVIPLGKSLTDGVAITAQEEGENLVVRLVRE